MYVEAYQQFIYCGLKINAGHNYLVGIIISQCSLNFLNYIEGKRLPYMSYFDENKYIRSNSILRDGIYIPPG